MDNTSQKKAGDNPLDQVGQVDKKAVDRKLVSQPTNAVQPKPEIKTPAGHYSSNLIQTTLQKMFHLEGASEKPKSSNGSKTSSAISEFDEDIPQLLNGTKSQEASQLNTSNSELRHTNPMAPKPRFQTIKDGTHVHNLQPKKVPRMQNLLKELGLHVYSPIEEKTHGNPFQHHHHHHHHRPPYRQCHSESSLTEKYGKCHEIIGKGAFGIVRIAHKTEPKVPGEKLFAVKEFKRRHNEPPKKYIKRLTSEFCISSSLQHINVINTLDLLQDTQGNYCEVMEYCAGGDLYSLIVSSGGLRDEEADCFFGQLINGVKYLHDNGVAHRDLKPENLLLTSTGCLKITDFGNGECFRMAWETQPHLSRGICGSEPYIAPEEFTEDWFDPRLVDVWACGIIYMGMMTGRQLWRVAKAQEDGNFKIFLQARAHGELLGPFQALCDGRRNIVGRIIEPNPKRRINVEQIIKDPWFNRINICCQLPLTSVDVGTTPVNSTCGGDASGKQGTNMNNSTLPNMVQ